MTTQSDIDKLAQQLGELLKKRQIMLALAESCTGGWIAATCTQIPGSAKWFDRSFVSYSNEAKIAMLQVNEATLMEFGAVSGQVAGEMAQGAINNSLAKISIAVTGIAGPKGGSLDKPVGTVWFGLGAKDKKVETHHFHFEGDRYTVRIKSVKKALELLINELNKNNQSA